MTSLPQPTGDDRSKGPDARLAAARRELARRKAEVRTARRRVRRLRRARLRRRPAALAAPVGRAGLAVLGTAAFVAGLLMLVRGDSQAADMLSAAAAFWALAVMLRRTGR